MNYGTGQHEADARKRPAGGVCGRRVQCGGLRLDEGRGPRCRRAEGAGDRATLGQNDHILGLRNAGRMDEGTGRGCTHSRCASRGSLQGSGCYRTLYRSRLDLGDDRRLGPALQREFGPVAPGHRHGFARRSRCGGGAGRDRRGGGGPGRG